MENKFPNFSHNGFPVDLEVCKVLDTSKTARRLLVHRRTHPRMARGLRILDEDTRDGRVPPGISVRFC